MPNQHPSPDFAVEFISPFSPFILKAKMPSGLVKHLNRKVDKILDSTAEASARDWSDYLAGNVSAEVKITDVMQQDERLSLFLFTLARRFVEKCPNLGLGQSFASKDKRGLRLRLEEAWANEMSSGDYSPLHFHPNCHLSSVGYLRLPAGLSAERRQKKWNKSSVGCLQFVDSRTVMGASNMLLVKPVVGEFYMFPAWLLHCVYPFNSAGTRRSFSANLSVVQNEVVER